MEYYANLGGDSGIRAYEVGSDSIKVEFKDGSIYLYNNQSAGPAAIEEMKRLAATGQGLNSYISRIVKKGYAKKIR